ncbi:MAG: dihydroorotate dehydrogenase electron transfer subunit [Bacteroidales bacterium]|jgi:dihydroorotate dehydrogenase electron transfer subunit|nr:dihydroorotate dehydrogenase electron transfer subunit [Bacteroidales bacterium]
MKKYIDSLLVVKNQRLNKDYFLLKLQSEEDLPFILPAQFVEVKIPDTSETFLRRPVSIHDVNYDKNTITLLIRIAGKGTLKLSETKKYEYLNIVYPLGNSFSMPSCNKVLLIGGGCGVAPLLYTAKYMLNFGITPTLLMGYRNSKLVLLKDKYAKYGNVYYSTDDGSYGEKGTVLEHSLLNSRFFPFGKIYACGPDAMLKDLGKWAIERGIDCEVSLENLMACGIGACLCCVQDTVSGHKCVCTEGPVFNVKELIW